MIESHQRRTFSNVSVDMWLRYHFETPMLSNYDIINVEKIEVVGFVCMQRDETKNKKKIFDDEK